MATRKKRSTQKKSPKDKKVAVKKMTGKKPVGKKPATKKTSKKQPPTAKTTAKRGEALQKLHNELRALCPLANNVSLVHLAVAIFTKRKLYLTGDFYILKRRGILQKKYKLTAASSMDEGAAALGGVKSPLEFYI